MRSSPRYRIMSDTPFVGWIVPSPWQEPEYEDDDINQEREDNSDYDDEGEFTLR
jgi:hypothetical protein